ncbi:MAG: DoxX family membrane protein [bacterium]|nr:DoxX family membrane protein [bacterium]
MFNKENIFRTVNLGLRIYLGGVFLFACYYKILHSGDFALSIASYQLLPLTLVNFFAVTLPWVELFAGVGIILGFQPRENSLIIIGMMLMFIFVIGSALSRDLAMGCGCFASTEAAEEISITTLVRDVIWLVIAVYLFFAEDGKWGLEVLFQRTNKHNA